MTLILKVLWYFFIGYFEVSIFLICLKINDYRLKYIDLTKNYKALWICPVFVIASIALTPAAAAYGLTKKIMKVSR